MRIGDYEIVETLGEGGMGIVYRARDPHLGRDVALKRLSVISALRPDELERFHREAAAVARLNHPNIVRIHSLGERSGVPYFAMDLIDGESLAARLKRGPLPAAEAVTIAGAIARALGHAHEAGILHRDVKPANVLIRTDNGAPLLTDFGLAKDLSLTREQLTRTGQMLGTPSYMSPEQASGELDLVGPPTDIYGLGATLYTLLTGRPPFVGASAINVIKAVLSNAPEPPSTHSPDLPPALDAICLRCLAKAPCDRYASAGELAEDLERLQRGEPTHALASARRGRPRAWLAAGALAIGSIMGVAALLTPTDPARPSPAAAPNPGIVRPTPPPSTDETPAPARFTNARWTLVEPSPEEHAVFLQEHLLATSGEGGVQVWALEPSPSPRPLETLPTRSPIRSLAIWHGPRGARLLAGLEDGGVVLFDASSLEQISAIDLGSRAENTGDPRGRKRVLSIALPQDSRRAVVALSVECCVYWLDLSREAQPKVLGAHFMPGSVAGLAFAQNGTRLIVGWDTPETSGPEQGETGGHALIDLSGELTQAARGLTIPRVLLPEGDGWLLGDHFGGIARISSSLEVSRPLEESVVPSPGLLPRAHSGPIRGLARLPDGRLLSLSGQHNREAKATPLDSDEFRTWNPDGSPDHTFQHPRARETFLLKLALSPSGRLMAVPQIQEPRTEAGERTERRVVEIWEIPSPRSRGK